METIEKEKYIAYQQKELETISNKIKVELMTELASKNKTLKHYFRSIKKENLDKLSIDELNNVIENSMDPTEIQVFTSYFKVNV